MRSRLSRVHDGCETGCDYDSLDFIAVLLGALQHAQCTIDCWVDEVLVWVFNFEVEGRRGMLDGIYTFDGFIETILVLEIFDDDIGEVLASELLD